MTNTGDFSAPVVKMIVPWGMDAVILVNWKNEYLLYDSRKTEIQCKSVSEEEANDFLNLFKKSPTTTTNPNGISTSDIIRRIPHQIVHKIIKNWERQPQDLIIPESLRNNQHVS